MGAKKLILGIETSCDETALSLVEARGGITNPRFRVLKNLVASQIEIHRPFGGVVPNLAKREHLINLPLLWKRFMINDSRFKNKKLVNRKSKIVNPPIDMIAVTVGPGLEPALWAGIEFAKKLGKELDVPVLGVNHLEGHLYSFLLAQKAVNSKSQASKPKRLKFGSWSLKFPSIALIVSGGHTTLLLLKDLETRKRLGETRDDAVGEAFDKVARILGLPYPGGPEIEKLALRWIRQAHHGQARRKSNGTIEFPRPMMHQKNYDFSFSGLKTSVLYYLRDNPRANKADIAASFQQAAIDVLVAKTMCAVNEYSAKSVLLSGGVAANKALRAALQKETKKINTKFFVADPIYNTDNAAMIAVAGYMNLFRKKKFPLTARGNMTI